MNHSQKICTGDPSDFNYVRYAGWSEANPCVRKFFSNDTIRLISNKVTQLTLGLDRKNRPIIVPDIRICEVMDGVFQGFTPAVGDIYSRYIIPNHEQENYVQSLIDQTIEIIVSFIRNTYGMEEWNESLSAWVQMYGDFNIHGLRQHAPIKILEKRPSTMQFNMNY